jgi:hypothetical protein
MEIVYESPIINVAESIRVLVQLGERLSQLSGSAVLISLTEMMKSDRRLNQTLIEESQRPPGGPPHVFPSLVSFKIASRVKKNYSVFKRSWHGVVGVTY